MARQTADCGASAAPRSTRRWTDQARQPSRDAGSPQEAVMLTYRHVPSVRRYGRLAALAAVLAALLMLAPGAVPSQIAVAQTTQPAQPRGIEGSWTLNFPSEDEDPTHHQLVAFLPGGVVIATNAPTFTDESVPGGRVLSSQGLGSWEAAGAGRFAFTVVFLYFEQDETPWGALTVAGDVALDSAGDR